MLSMEEILNYCVRYEASDVHIMVGVQPYIRLHGRLTPIPETDIITPQVSRELIESVLSDEQKEILEREREMDFSYSLKSGVRFRVNVFYEKGNLAGAFRAIPNNIRSIDDLGLPNMLYDLTKLKQGLILVTGPTGHGKSTTLAAMIEEINSTRSEHIVTIEDPIEFVYEQKKSIVAQRELNADTHSWSAALRSVLREDPDVVLVGEMRDLDTISAALTVAETGHLVFSTLHTNSAAQTIDRIVDVFPKQQQQQIRMQLAGVLEAVLSQRLVPSLDGKRVAVMEILLGTPAVRNNIREGKTHLIKNAIQTSSDVGMKTMDTALAEAYLSKKISLDVGRQYSQNVDEFSRIVGTYQRG